MTSKINDENSIVLQIMQLSGRLEDASSNERLEAIRDLYTIARSNVNYNQRNFSFVFTNTSPYFLGF